MKFIFLIKTTAFIFLISLFASEVLFSQQLVDQVQVKMNSRTMNKGKYTSIIADIWYQAHDGKMVSHYTSPYNMVVITNNKGEAQLYNVEQNTINTQQNQAFSTQGGYFYYFLANKLNDLGLTEMGFQILDTKFSGTKVISKWLPPSSLLTALKHVELVLDDYKPVYMAYYNPKGKLIRKVYYYNYRSLSNMVSIPLTVTEINYLGEGDSILTKTVYSDVKINLDVEKTGYLNFKIPADAKKMVD